MASFTVSAYFPGDILRLNEDMAPKKLSMRPLVGAVFSSKGLLPFVLLLGILLLVLTSEVSDNDTMCFLVLVVA